MPVSDATMTVAETAAKILGNALCRIGTSLPNSPAPNLRTWTNADENVRFESSFKGEMAPADDHQISSSEARNLKGVNTIRRIYDFAPFPLQQLQTLREKRR
jgi:hypothetical protein